MKFDVPAKIAKADLPAANDRPGPNAPGRRHGGSVQIPSSPRTGGAEYVWHCHILEREEHDMMRPLVVIWEDSQSVRHR
jgi:FtsP/CotA-like multicopper oxidase with cupredoxin domain